MSKCDVLGVVADVLDNFVMAHAATADNIFVFVLLGADAGAAETEINIDFNAHFIKYALNQFDLSNICSGNMACNTAVVFRRSLLAKALTILLNYPTVPPTTLSSSASLIFTLFFNILIILLSDHFAFVCFLV